MPKDIFQPDRKGLVEIAQGRLADLFGPDVTIEAVAVRHNGNLLLLVSGHQSLPVVGPGDAVPIVYPEITELSPLSRTVTFRGFEPALAN